MNDGSLYKVTIPCASYAEVSAVAYSVSECLENWLLEAQFEARGLLSAQQPEETIRLNGAWPLRGDEWGTDGAAVWRWPGGIPEAWVPAAHLWYRKQVCVIFTAGSTTAAREFRDLIRARFVSFPGVYRSDKGVKRPDPLDAALIEMVRIRPQSLYVFQLPEAPDWKTQQAIYDRLLVEGATDPDVIARDPEISLPGPEIAAHLPSDQHAKQVQLDIASVLDVHVDLVRRDIAAV